MVSPLPVPPHAQQVWLQGAQSRASAVGGHPGPPDPSTESTLTLGTLSAREQNRHPCELARLLSSRRQRTGGVSTAPGRRVHGWKELWPLLLSSGEVICPEP